MILAPASFPTPSTVAIAEASGLLPKNLNKTREQYFDIMERLAQFQQMALMCDIEECRIAFFGIELSDDHNTALELIYRTTRPWIFGHVVGGLLNLINRENTNGKDAIEAARTILSNLVADGSISKDAAEQFIVNVYKQSESENAQ